FVSSLPIVGLVQLNAPQIAVVDVASVQATTFSTQTSSFGQLATISTTTVIETELMEYSRPDPFDRFGTGQVMPLIFIHFQMHMTNWGPSYSPPADDDSAYPPTNSPPTTPLPGTGSTGAGASNGNGSANGGNATNSPQHETPPTNPSNSTNPSNTPHTETTT